MLLNDHNADQNKIKENIFLNSPWFKISMYLIYWQNRGI